MKDQPPPPDDLPAELQRLGIWVVVGILAWSAGWLAVHKIVEARQHAVAADLRR